MEARCKLLSDNCTASQQENKRLKDDNLESKMTLRAQKEIIDLDENAGLLQRSLEEEKDSRPCQVCICYPHLCFLVAASRYWISPVPCYSHMYEQLFE
mmetsp:Transcript_30249/g.64100  ORF Transcript_30249/g.64100 Transcript_30249/m.64100 type:complete len:98 (+) Transcript_30249:574-867(+)